jgi:hypothetical protein
VRPFTGLVRLDSFGYPVVIPKGSVFVTAGTDRRSSGTHYTPRSLTEPIVQYTLEPLVYVGPAEGTPKNEWRLKSAKELLELKICDMACGSGAFLVQAARYMAERLLEAWDVAKRANPNTPGITPEGAPFTGKANEALIPDDPAERKTYALRIIAQRCLYGVDKNPLAAEMAKLSLWLLTLAKDKPFEFLDHAIRCGDSLVGIHNLDQVRRFNLDGKGEDNRLFLQFLDKRIEEAITLRRQIAEMQANTVEDVEAQDRMLREVNEKIDRLKCAADMLIAAEFVPGSAADKRAARDNAAIKVAVHFHDSDLPMFRREVQKALSGQVTFHWPLEFPEVVVERGGFDAVMGNPPFLGGSRIRGSLGLSYLNFLNAHWGPTNRADLCIFFLLRANAILRTAAGFGLVVTNTVGEGDSRKHGLERLLTNGSQLFRAVSSQKWPGNANLEVSHIWIRNGDWNGQSILDGRSVPRISSFLVAEDESVGTPHRLSLNASCAFNGTKVYGQGFLLSPEEAQTVLERNPEYRKVLFPYLIGDDVNGHPSQQPSRWTINFFDWPLNHSSTPAGYKGSVAADYPECLAIVEELVKPERTRRLTNGDFALREPLPQKWWIYGDKRPALYSAIKNNTHVLVRALTSKHHGIVFVPNGWVYDQCVSTFAFSDWATYSILQSDIHYKWTLAHGSKFETRPRYTVLDCFENFPFPTQLPVDVAGNEILLKIGNNYHEYRRNVMLDRSEGLTATYNRFHNPDDTIADIQKLRLLHVEMDNAVAAAYGWADLNLGHHFHETKQGVRYTISEAARREVLTRLLRLNHDRYAEEVKQGLHDKKGAAKKSASKKKIAGKSVQAESTLFDLGEDDE